MVELDQEWFLKSQKPWYQFAHQTGNNFEFNREKLIKILCQVNMIFISAFVHNHISVCELYFPIEWFSIFAAYTPNCSPTLEPVCIPLL